MVDNRMITVAAAVSPSCGLQWAFPHAAQFPTLTTVGLSYSQLQGSEIGSIN